MSRTVAQPAGPLARRDPSVLLLAVVAVPLVLVGVRRPLPVLVLWLVALLVAALVARVPVRRLALGQVPFLGFAASLVMVNAVTRGGEVLAAWGPVEVTDDGLRLGATFALRTLLVGVVAVTFLWAVEPARLLTSLHQVARLPLRAAVALLAAHRILDDLPGEWRTIRAAQAVRAHRPARSRRPLRGTRGRGDGGAGEGGEGGDRRGTLAAPTDVRSVGRAAFVLLATSLRRADQVAQSLESRALGATGREGRTVRAPAHLSWPDAVALVSVVGACAVVAVAAR